ncbi:MAG: cyanophycin synthetase, partial [Pirellulaceae bacterium]|nr:cyanophycin synthetase [Pirellulaceae bacterium]
QDKELTREFLRAAGVPTPRGRTVVDAEDAWDAACEVGVPVVVKPRDGNQGRGVATNLHTREQVAAAFAAAKLESDSVLVEQFAPGQDYRLLIVGERLAAAARREPAHVIGDGSRTINQLIEKANQDPRRGDHHATVLSKIKLDAVSLAVLSEQGHSPESVPSEGERVLIRRNANLSTGGTAIDVTERVHPAVTAGAIDAARSVGLDIAGIDVVAQDISRPLQEQSGVVVEVNAAPGLRMHLQPSAGISRPVGEAIVELMFPPGEDGRVPIVAVTGVNGKTTTTRFIAHILRGTGKCVGMTCTDGIYIDDHRIDCEDCSGPQSARSALMNPNVEAAVFETARGGILREGLAFDLCDIAVVTNIGDGDHLGLCDVNTPEELAKVKRCIVEAVAPSGYAVLNAADPLVVEMAGYCPGGIVFFAADPNCPAIERHLKVGGRAVFVRNRKVIFAEGDRAEEIIPLDQIPLTRGGEIAFQVENALAAVAGCWSLGVPPDTIRRRAASFTADIDKVPARFNVFDIEGATVVVDYGHNAHSLSAVIQAIEKFPHSKRSCVYSTAGDRRDCDIINIGRLLGDSFDRVVIYEDHYLRGRPSGEIMALLRKGLDSAGRTKDIIEVRGANNAAEAALGLTKPGELLLLQADRVDETICWLRGYVEQRVNRTPEELCLHDFDEQPPLAAEEQLHPVPASSDLPGDVLAETNASVK